jgi:outer membrane protein OmpA-like peptidoglycan-associated protein
LKRNFNLLLISLLFTLLSSSLSIAQEKIAKPENLGKGVNTECDEIMPVIAPDGKTLYFCRSECEGGFGAQDIWFSHLQANGEWTKAENVGPPLNNKYNNFVCAVTPDGNTLLLGNEYREDGTIGRGVSITHRTATGWSFPEKVKIDNYYNLDEFSSFFLGNDGKTLLMSIKRTNSLGEKDIYVSFLQDDGVFSEPMSLGPTINTKGNELTPFLASDGVSLYFSSTGQEGYGNADVFFSRRLDKTWENWSTPVNLGPTINTKAWDAYLKLTASGLWAYFVSTLDTYGKTDIFRIQLPEKLKPLPVLLIYGKVLNAKTRQPIPGTITYEIIPQKKEAGIAHADPKDGNYTIILPVGEKYVFLARSDGFYASKDTMNLKLLSLYTELERDIELVPTEDSIFCFRNILFKSGKATLQEESTIEVDKVYRFLVGNPELDIEINAHTDSDGADEMNQDLSERRAKTIYDYLVNKGIEATRMAKHGFGETQPLTDNDTPEGKKLNRRVEFRIIKRR